MNGELSIPTKSTQLARRIANQIGGGFRRYAIFLILAALILFFDAIEPAFLRPNNLFSVLQSAFEAGVARQAKALGVDLRIFQGKQDAAQQREQIEQAISLGVEGFALSSCAVRYGLSLRKSILGLSKKLNGALLIATLQPPLPAKLRPHSVPTLISKLFSLHMTNSLAG
jgi:hypothetical protein